MRTFQQLSALVLTLLCGAAGATPPASAPASATSSPGLTVVRDAETGQLRGPTSLELQALRRATTSRPAPPVEVTGALGERSVELGERALVYSVLRRGQDGQVTQHCVDSAQAATQILAQPAAPAGASRHDHR